MIIEIHPESAKRANEIARSLVQMTNRHPRSKGGEPEFRPDIHPTMRFTAADMRGEPKIRMPILNGKGEEIGRVLSIGAQECTFIGESYGRVLQLVDLLLKNPSLRETVSRSWLLDTTFDWITAALEGLERAEFTAFIVGGASEGIREWEIWTPLFRVYLEKDFPFGDVNFRVITKGMLDRYYNRLNFVGKPEPAITALQQRINRQRASLQACAAVVVKVTAESTKAHEIAEVKSDHAIALLRFLAPANFTAAIRSYCKSLGSEALEGRTTLLVKDDDIMGVGDALKVVGEHHWTISSLYLSEVQESVNELGDLAANHQTPLREALFTAFLIYSRNSIVSDPADKLVYLLVSLESMLLRNSTEPVQKNIAERIAFMTGKSVESRIQIKKNVEDVYGLRSAFVHHGQSVKDMATLELFMTHAWNCLYALLLNSKRYRTKDELIEVIERRKMA